MSRKKQAEKTEFVLFNVVYEDGSLSSIRRVPTAALDGLDGDAPARAGSSKPRNATSPTAPAFHARRLRCLKGRRGYTLRKCAHHGERGLTETESRLALVERFFSGTGDSYDFMVNATTFGGDPVYDACCDGANQPSV